MGGLQSPSPTPTHQYRPSCPAGLIPLPGSSGRVAGLAAGQGLAGQPPTTTPLLLPPGLNLSLQTAQPESHAPGSASFENGLATVLALYLIQSPTVFVACAPPPRPRPGLRLRLRLSQRVPTAPHRLQSPATDAAERSTRSRPCDVSLVHRAWYPGPLAAFPGGVDR